MLSLKQITTSFRYIAFVDLTDRMKHLCTIQEFAELRPVFAKVQKRLEEEAELGESEAHG